MEPSRPRVRPRPPRQKGSSDAPLRPLCVKLPKTLFAALETLMARETRTRMQGRTDPRTARLPPLTLSEVVRRLLEFGAGHPEVLAGSGTTVAFTPEMEAQEAKLRAAVAAAAAAAADTYDRPDALGERADLHAFVAGVGWEMTDLHEFWLTGKLPAVRPQEFLAKVNAYLDTLG